ncbi:MAG: hypothetical protein ACT4SY_06045 [Hyphomicrobiales bacterium]
MFDGKRKRVTAHTIAALRPLVGIFQNRYGIPSSFWRNEFVLGFFAFMLAFHRDFTSNEKLGDYDRGVAMVDILTALSNMNGHAIAQKITELATAQSKSEEFESGGDNAAILAYYTLGKLKNANDNPYVKEAKHMAAASGSPDDPLAIAGFLGLLVFADPIARRLGLSSNQGD